MVQGDTVTGAEVSDSLASSWLLCGEMNNRSLKLIRHTRPANKSLQDKECSKFYTSFKSSNEHKPRTAPTVSKAPCSGVSSVQMLVTQACLTLWPHGLKPARLLCPWDSPGKNTGVGCHALLQGLFLTQGLKPVSRLAGRFFTSWATREAWYRRTYYKTKIDSWKANV